MSDDARSDPATPRVPSSRAGAEQVLLLLVVLHRFVVLVQACVALPLITGVGRPAFLLVVLWTVVAVAVMARRRRTLRWVAVADVLVCCAAVYVNHLSFSGVGTWADWSFALGLSSATLAGAVATTWRWPLAAGTAFSVIYATTSMLVDDSSRFTVLANGLAFFGYALVLRGLGGFLRRLGATADEARRTAALAAAEAERERHRRLLHDQKTILEFLGRRGNDEALETALRRQATRNAARIDRFLHAGSATPSPDQFVPLRDVVLSTAADFDDLPLTVTVYRADCLLSPSHATNVSDALETLLHNVRRHAEPDEVVVHAEDTPSGFSIVVRDDGRGFDPVSTVRGYGLGVLIGEELPRAGIVTRIRSTVGDGTRVELRGPATTPAPVVPSAESTR